MANEELERIKQAYSSGLKVQIWFNGHWEDFDIRDYSMFPEPFSEHRQYRIVGSTYADTAEKQIKELEKENEELKEKVSYLKDNLRVARKDRENLQLEVARGLKEFVKDYPATALRFLANERYVEQLTKAKGLLKKWVECFKPKGGNIPPTPIQIDTEQFLNEVEK